MMPLSTWGRILLLAPMVHSHMIMVSPPPYGSPNNSPVEADGSNFPCKATSNSDGQVTEMVIGATQKLSFKGSAVHGGGSCQLSLTTDTPATRSSKWQVIHSIVGGCPARQAAGNLGGGASAFNPDTYEYAIPPGVAPGSYTLAWTWYNRIGNRELYMNCASIKVKDTSKKRDIAANETLALMPRDSSFPDMFVANIPTTACVTIEGKDVAFPNPGNSVEKAGQPQDLAAPQGPRCLAGPGGVSGGQNASPVSNAIPGPSPSAVFSSGPASNGSPLVPASSPSAAENSLAVAFTPAAPVSTKAASTAIPNAIPAATKGASTSIPNTIPCDFAGQPVCSADKTLIGLCDLNLRAVLTPVPSGTVCRDGFISVSPLIFSSAHADTK